MMKSAFLALPLVLLATVAQAAPPTAEAILAALNAARADPVGYAQNLRQSRRFYEGKIYRVPGEMAVMTDEGVAAVDDAIRFLERQQPQPPMSLSAPLTRSARVHALDQQRNGGMGHNSSDGSTFVQRITREASFQGMAAENIAYGDNDAAGVIRQLIVDDGVADRGHRIQIFSPLLKNMGAACAGHAQYDQVCVLDHATAVIEKVD